MTMSGFPWPGQLVLVEGEEMLGRVDGPPRVCVKQPDGCVLYVALEQLAWHCDHGVPLGQPCEGCRRGR